MTQEDDLQPGEVELLRYEEWTVPGAQVAGVYLGAVEIETQSTPSGRLLQHYIATEAGVVYFSATYRLAMLARVAVGSGVRVRYTGTVKIGGGRQLKQFRVYIEQGAYQPVKEALTQEARADLRAIVAPENVTTGEEE